MSRHHGIKSFDEYFSNIQIQLYSFIMKHMVPEPILRRQIIIDRCLLRDCDKRSEDWLDSRNNNNYLKEIIWSGSKVETLTLAFSPNVDGDFSLVISDVDTMIVLNGFIASEEENMSPESTDDEQLFTIPASHAGYTKNYTSKDKSKFSLRFDEDLSGTVHCIRNDLRSDKKFLQCAIEHILEGFNSFMNISKKQLHGPSICYEFSGEHPSGTERASMNTISKTGLEIDIVLSIKHPSWPLIANEWRERITVSGWPTNVLKTEILKNGCHLVAVGHTKSDDQDNEWRYSFSLAERILARNISTPQRATYIISKIIFKRIFHEGSSISSYLLKTIFLYMCEDLKSDNWAYDNLGYYVFTLFYRLLESLNKQSLCNYFIPTNNMIDHILPNVIEAAISKINKMMLDPWDIIHDFKRKIKLQGFYSYPEEEIFLPIYSMISVSFPLCGEKDIIAILNDISWTIIKLYCQWFKKDIPSKSFFAFPFAKLRVQLIVHVVLDIVLYTGKPFQITMEPILETIDSLNPDNSSIFHKIAENYFYDILLQKSVNYDLPSTIVAEIEKLKHN